MSDFGFDAGGGAGFGTMTPPVDFAPQPVAVPAPGTPDNPAAAPLAPWPAAGVERGIRNNNPGNVEFRPRDPWEGQLGSDGRFAVMQTPEHGIRAMSRLLTNYQQQYGLNTLAGMITRYAPPRENPTAQYIRGVSQMVGLPPNQPFDFRADPELAQRIMGAMIQHENGRNPYTPEQMQAGWRLAFPEPPAQEQLDESAQFGAHFGRVMGQ